MSDTHSTPADEDVAAGRTEGRPRLAVGLAGAGAAAAQVVIIRELLVASAGNELSIAAVLAAWLLWEAVGAWLGGRVIARSRRSPVSHMGAVALAEVGLLALALALSRAGLLWLRSAFAGALMEWGLVPPAGGTLSLPQLLVLTTLVVAPAGVVLGWQFAAGCALLGAGQSDGRPGAALAYVWDSLGHLLGGAALSVGLVTRLPEEWVLLVGLGLVLLGVWLLRPVAWRLVVGLVAGTALVAAIIPFRRATISLRWHPYAVRDVQSGPLGSVTVLQGEGGELSFFESGAYALETAEVLAGEQWIHLPLLAHPSPRAVLLVGGGPRALREVLAHRPDSVHQYELDPTLAEAVRRHAPLELTRVFDDPAVTAVAGDARLHLPRLRRAGVAFDVVLVALPDPSTAQVNRYYTLEWMREAGELLDGRGILSFQATSSANYLSPEVRAYNACLYRTAERAGFRVTALPGQQVTFVCTRGGGWAAIYDDYMAVEQRLKDRGLDADLLLASFYDALDPARQAQLADDLQASRQVRLNRDLSPTCYYYAQVLWASWWRGKTAALLKLAEGLNVSHVLWAVALAASLLALPTALVRRPIYVAGPCAVFVAGAGGMMLEVLLLLGLQSLYGYVYGIVGFVVGVLMAGLAAGAGLVARRLSGETGSAAGQRVLIWAQAGLVVVAALTAAGLTWLAKGAGGPAGWAPLPLVVVTILMAATGIAVGSAFPAALVALRDESDGLPRGTALYAVDLVGACGGALLAGLVLVPLMGAIGTCLVIAALGVGSASLCALAGLVSR